MAKQEAAPRRLSSKSTMSVPQRGTCRASTLRLCHTRVLGVQSPGANIITRCAGTKPHTYDESWHRIECHIFTITGVLYKINN
jgi:hypothetical protein